jgi:hypothetical protein
MVSKAAVDYLAGQVNEAIDRADSRRRKHKWFSVVIRVLATLCTVAIPVLLGWKGISERNNLLQNLAMCLGGLATILLGYEAFYGHRELWAINTAAATQLKNLRLDLDYRTSDGSDTITREELDRWHTRLKEIVSEADSAWVGVRQAGARHEPPQPDLPRSSD